MSQNNTLNRPRTHHNRPDNPAAVEAAKRALGLIDEPETSTQDSNDVDGVSVGTTVFSFLNHDNLIYSSNVRGKYDPDYLEAFGAGVQEARRQGVGINGCGIIHPCWAYPDKDDPKKYHVVSGNLRSLSTVKVLADIGVPFFIAPNEADAQKQAQSRLYVQLLENLERRDITIVDEVENILKLKTMGGLSNGDLIRMFSGKEGRGRGWVQNTVFAAQALAEDETWRDVLERGDTRSHIKVIHPVKEPLLRKSLRRMLANGASERRLREVRDIIQPLDPAEHFQLRQTLIAEAERGSTADKVRSMIPAELQPKPAETPRPVQSGNGISVAYNPPQLQNYGPAASTQAAPTLPMGEYANKAPLIAPQNTVRHYNAPDVLPEALPTILDRCLLSLHQWPQQFRKLKQSHTFAIENEIEMKRKLRSIIHAAENALKELE